jgi:hypothetical protein
MIELLGSGLVLSVQATAAMPGLDERPDGELLIALRPASRVESDEPV